MPDVATHPAPGPGGGPDAGARTAALWTTARPAAAPWLTAPWLTALWTAALWTAALWTVTGLLVLWSAVRLAGWERGNLAVQLMAFTPYVAAGSLLPLAAAVVSRQWTAAAVAGLAVLALGGS